MMKYSFGILKPDCVERNLIEKVFQLIRARELKIIYSKQIRLSERDVEFLYGRCRQYNFFENMIKFMTSGDVVIYLVKSKNEEDAIRILNSVTGSTDPTKAKQGTLRGLGENVCRNIAHSTADSETFWSEVKYFLNNKEILTLGLELE